MVIKIRQEPRNLNFWHTESVSLSKYVMLSIRIVHFVKTERRERKREAES